MHLFVCLFFFQFLQSLKIMRPYPVCFSRASIYFWILVYPFHTALAYGHMMNELLAYLFRGGGGRVARCWTLGNFDSLCKVMMSRPVFAVKKPRARFFKNQYGKFISYSWSLSRIFSTVTVLLSFGDSYLKENNVCRENSDINLLVSLTNHPKPWCFEINNPG